MSLAEWRVQFEKRGEFGGVVRMPPRQRGTVANDVLRAPQDAAIVDIGSNIVIGADDVEIAVSHPLDQHIDYLIRGPGAGWLLRTSAGRHAGEGRARDQQMRSDTAILDVAQRMRKALGQDLHPGL